MKGLILIILLLSFSGCLTYAQYKQQKQAEQQKLVEQMEEQKLQELWERYDREDSKRLEEYQEQQQREKADLERKLAQHPEWTAQDKEYIRKHEIRIGMSKSAVIVSWGNPVDINRSVGSWGVHEQWEYSVKSGSTIGYKLKYLYFEDGILTSFQD
jgi:hypothetical protein